MHKKNKFIKSCKNNLIRRLITLSKDDGFETVCLVLVRRIVLISLTIHRITNRARLMACV